MDNSTMGYEEVREQLAGPPLWKKILAILSIVGVAGVVVTGLVRSRQNATAGWFEIQFNDAIEQGRITLSPGCVVEAWDRSNKELDRFLVVCRRTP